MNTLLPSVRALLILSALVSTEAAGSRAILIEARNLAYDANYRSDEAGLRSAIAALEPLTNTSADVPYVHYYLSWSHGALSTAQFLANDANRVTILNGQRAISGDTALRLAHFFGTSPQFWLNLRSLYEIRLAEEKSGKAIKKLPSLKRVEEIHA
jgi:addiction module HigA family antidote